MKTITMDYDEYLKFENEKEQFKECLKDLEKKGKVLRIYTFMGYVMGENYSVIEMPQAIKEVIRTLSMTEIKAIRKNK